MGLEGAVRLGFKKELDAIDDPEKREARFEELVALHYEHGKAINMAAALEIDDVIDPVETRQWIMRGLRARCPSRNGAAARNGRISTAGKTRPVV